MINSPAIAREAVEIPLQAGAAVLAGDLRVPEGAHGLVLFVHGSGSSRFSDRNRRVASALQQRGLATLLFDLLTAAEEQEDAITPFHRFDIPLLAGRLRRVTAWTQTEAGMPRLPLGYFGASTGAAAALMAAAVEKDLIRAVVSRGGRPDLAGEALGEVTAPTLLIVGGKDRQVLALNWDAFEQLRGERRLEVVPGAGHLFEEAGTLDIVAALAGTWLSSRLAIHRPPS
jgi:putative phosphoribosyl transferase